MDEAKHTLDTIGMQLVQEKKNADKETAGRDLLTLLIKANMGSAEEQQLSDRDVLAQIGTFLVAGHETTSTATAWCLFALSQQPGLQSRLRDELHTLPETPSQDALGALPLLDSVVREALRLYAPLAYMSRTCVKDDIIPLSVPITDRNGALRSEIHMRKGDSIHIPILGVNRSTQVWGPDALEFHPDRWTSNKDIPHGPGVMPGLLTFLGGPRNCIGWRFSVLEMKALLFYILSSFKVELAVPVEDIVQKVELLSRPFVKGGKEAQLPVIITPVDES